ncbi:MAG: fibrobacter succinogenes major paralogous domain-containing protein [Fibromonadales bacterium]|nr:fibrobacter succinogenes major paralogous domain-containing protein [Fibromonadales bacterium]
MTNYPFQNINNFGYWWSSDENSGTTNGAKLMKLDYYETYALIDTYTKASLYSVRCIKN